VALFTLIFRRGWSTHGSTYDEDAGQRSPVQDVTSVMQSNGERPTVMSPAVSTPVDRQPERWRAARAAADGGITHGGGGSNRKIAAPPASSQLASRWVDWRVRPTRIRLTIVHRQTLVLITIDSNCYSYCICHCIDDCLEDILLIISGQDNSNKSCSTKQEFDVYETRANWVRTLIVVVLFSRFTRVWLMYVVRNCYTIWIKYRYSGSFFYYNAFMHTHALI